MQKQQKVIMLGPSLDAPGGISAVVQVYRRSGFLRMWSVEYVPTVTDEDRFAKVSTAVAGFLRFSFLLIRGDTRLVHVHSASRWSFRRKSAFILFAWLLRKPVLFHLHGGQFLESYDNELSSAGRAYVRFILRRCSRVIVLSARWKDALGRITDVDRIEIVMNPVESPNVLQKRATKPGRSIVFLGRLEELKGVYDLVKALSRVDVAGGFTLHLGGIGDATGVQDLAEKLGVADRIELHGWTSGDAKNRLLASASALVLPSYAEGLPMSVIEAMAFGKPVVVTPVGGIPDIIEDGVNGLLVPCGDIDSLAVAIERLLSDPVLAESMGRNAQRKFEENFSADVILPKLGALYGAFGLSPAVDGAESA